VNARGWLNLALADVAEQIASSPEMKTSEKHPLTPKNLTARRACGRDSPKVRRSHSAVRLPEIRMIQDVEHLRTELQVDTFLDVRVLGY